MARYCFSRFLPDQEIRNIIDKLASFVARNGPEFERMTMEKQRSNPKFNFLFGGEYNLYYRWKVTTEQAGKTFVFVTKHLVVCFPVSKYFPVSEYQFYLLLVM